MYVNGSGLIVNYSIVSYEGPCGPYEGAFEETANGSFEYENGPYYVGSACQNFGEYTFPGFYAGSSTTLYGSYLNGDYWTGPASVSIYDSPF
jgi:hypothetical protein